MRTKILSRATLTLTLLLAGSLTSPSWAQLTSKYEALTVDATARSIATATTAGMDTCMAVLETAAVRWRHDGTDPTAAVGTPMSVGIAIAFTNATHARNSKFIRTGGTSGTLHVNCFQSYGAVSVTGSGSGGVDEPFVFDAGGGLRVVDDNFVADVTAGTAAPAGATVPPVGGTTVSSLAARTPYGNTQRFDLSGDLDGSINVRTYGSLADLSNSGAIDVAAGTSTSALAAAGASIKYYVTSVVCSNPVAGTDVLIDIRDGTAGAVKITIPCPAGGAIYNPPTPIPGFTANTAVAVDPSTTSTGLTVTVLAFKSKI